MKWTQDDEYLMGKKEFSTINELVDHHRITSFVCIDSEKPIRLKIVNFIITLIAIVINIWFINSFFQPYKTTRILITNLDKQVKEFRDTNDLYQEFKV